MRNLAFVLLAVLTLAGCSKKEQHVRLELPGWSEDVKTGINDFLDLYGKGGERYHDGSYVVFDFDNTTSIFDIQYQMIPFQLMTMAFEATPEEMPGLLSQDLTRMDICSEWIGDICRDYSLLYVEYGPFHASGIAPADTAELHSNPVWKDFATKMYDLYHLVYQVEPKEVRIGWMTSWFQGMTNEQIYVLSTASHQAFKDVETSVVKWDGPVPCLWTSGISVTDELKELWRVLKKNGLDVWVCSGSQLEQVRAAVDVFGLHDYCAGILAVPTKFDSTTAGYLALPDGGWQRDTLETGGYTWSYGKVTAIDKALVSRYGHGPEAGFMDSSGDFHFCNEYSSLKMVICFNTADKAPKDPAGLVAETALYERDHLGYDLRKANDNGDTFFLLQGRNENGKRTLIPSNATIKYGSNEELLFKGPENQALIESFKADNLSVKDIFDNYALGSVEGYTGYHSK